LLHDLTKALLLPDELFCQEFFSQQSFFTKSDSLLLLYAKAKKVQTEFGLRNADAAME